MFPSHDELIRLVQLLAKDLGYLGDIESLSKGICYGYSGIAAEPIFTKGISKFQQQMRWVKQLIDEQHILEPDGVIPEEQKPKLLKLVKKILTHHKPGNIISVRTSEHNTPIQEIAQTMQIVQSKALNAQGGLHKVAEFKGSYNLEGDDLQRYLLILKETVNARADYQKIPFVFFLARPKHATLLSYSPIDSPRPWHFCNSNPSPIQINDSGEIGYYHVISVSSDKIEALAFPINDGLSVTELPINEISSRMYCAGTNYTTAIKLAASFFANLEKNNLTIKNSHNVNFRATYIGNTAKWAPIHLAAYSGNTVEIESLIQQNFNVNFLDSEEWSALMFAAQGGHIEAVSLLIGYGAEINRCNRNQCSILYIAAQYGHPEVVDLLLKNGAYINARNKNGYSPLYIAARYGHAAVVALLLKEGADSWNVQDKWSALFIAVKKRHTAVIDLFLNNGVGVNAFSQDGQSVLMFAARYGHTDIVHFLIEKGADIAWHDKNGHSSLYLAAQYGHIKAVRLLLKKGAHIWNTQDKWSALLTAIEHKHIAIINFLFENGVDVNWHSQNRWSALMFAAAYGHTEVVRFLLKKDADINWHAQDGQSPLCIAAQHGRIEIVLLLIEQGADINTPNKNGDSPLCIAVQHGQFKIIDLLIEHGANPDSLNHCETSVFINMIENTSMSMQLDNLFTKHHHHLWLPFLNALFLSDPVQIDNIKSCKLLDIFVEVFKENLSILLQKNPLTLDDKKNLIKLYIVLHDDKERYKRNLIPSNFDTFFESGYIKLERNLNYFFREKYTYEKKREAALLLLKAIENEDSTVPSHPALQQGLLGKIAERCFFNIENHKHSKYFHMSMPAS